MELGLVKRLSVREIQKTVLQEYGVGFSEDEIRNFLATRPSALMEEATDRGLVEHVTPILDYATELRTGIEELKGVRQKFINALNGSSDDDMGKILSRYLDVLREMRAQIELASKLDQSVTPKGGTGPVNVDKGLFLTPADLQNMVKDVGR